MALTKLVAAIKEQALTQAGNLLKLAADAGKCVINAVASKLAVFAKLFVGAVLGGLIGAIAGSLLD